MSFIQRILWCIGLLALQVVLCNHIHILGYATPMPFIYLLIIFHSTTARWKYVLWGFGIGILTDIMTKNPGECAAAATLLGLVIPTIRDAFAPEEQGDDGFAPSLRTMKTRNFILYATSATLLYTIVFYIIEACSFFHPREMIINILASTVLTVACIYGIEKTVRHERL